MKVYKIYHASSDRFNLQIYKIKTRRPSFFSIIFHDFSQKISLLDFSIFPIGEINFSNWGNTTAQLDFLDSIKLQSRDCNAEDFSFGSQTPPSPGFLLAVTMPTVRVSSSHTVGLSSHTVGQSSHAVEQSSGAVGRTATKHAGWSGSSSAIQFGARSISMTN